MSSNAFVQLQGLLTPEELRRMDECEELRVISETLTAKSLPGAAGERVELAERAKRSRETVVRTPR